MEAQVEAQFSDEIRDHLLACFGSRADLATALGGFENYMYLLPGEAGGKALRIGHSSHRTRVDVQAELHWLEYLDANGAPVCRPMPSETGNVIEEVSVGEDYFLASAFEFAPGELVSEKDWSATLFERWGAVLGQLHRLSSDYQPEPGKPRRFTWQQDPYVRDCAARLADDPALAERLAEHLEHFASLPRDPSVFALIHNDLHHNNFHYAKGQLRVFDSDDCCYHWLVQDLAVVFYHAQWHPAARGRGDEVAEQFFPDFWRGYWREHNLPVHWLAVMPELMLFRDLIMITVLKLKLGHRPDQRYHDQLQRLRGNVLSRKPSIGVDFERLAASL